MTRFLPQPWLSLMLFLLWLLLVNSVAPGHLVLGAILALLLPLFTQRFWPDRPAVQRPLVALRLLGVVLLDIVLANLTVARQVLGPVKRLHPRFVRVPLDLTHEFPITILASIISLTPGTVSVDVTPDRKALLVHGLSVDDEPALVADIKARYEAPLMEVFRC
ncbi:MAG: Na+/H+ antiporter subunit E [Chromatiales bacterium]|nr:Na+/H+ antiporter subunit E [Chromatiales bacterium]MDX9768129.1 Na+/H+ antiporter subunit E [Ectothiorhodospiraceae bacterium]